MTCDNSTSNSIVTAAAKKTLAMKKLAEAGREATVRELVKEVSTSGPLIQCFMDAGLRMTLAEYVQVIYDSDTDDSTHHSV